jgi:hypothetical protein
MSDMALSYTGYFMYVSTAVKLPNGSIVIFFAAAGISNVCPALRTADCVEVRIEASPSVAMIMINVSSSE